MSDDLLQNNALKSQSPAQFYRVIGYVRRQSYFENLNLERLAGVAPLADSAEEWRGVFVKLDPEEKKSGGLS